MSKPYCLSVAGFDPSGGAGSLADAKTFEQLGVYGLGAVTALTYQNDQHFDGLDWSSWTQAQRQLDALLHRFPVRHVKVGIVPSLSFLHRLVVYLKAANNDIRIVWDPVIKSTTGFSFFNDDAQAELPLVLEHLSLVTPNVPEFNKLWQCAPNDLPVQSTAILLKGGHRDSRKGTDMLIEQGRFYELEGTVFGAGADKHGTGCVLSSAITAYLAWGKPMQEACALGKKYVEAFMLSNTSRLGYHVKESNKQSVR